MSQPAKNAKEAIENPTGMSKDTVTDTKEVVKELAHKVESTAEEAVRSGKQAVHNIVDGAKEAAAEVSEKVQNTARQGRRTASEAIDASGRHMRNIDEEASPLIDHFANRAQDLAERSIHFWADSSHRARRQFSSAADATNKYVAEQPGRSLLIAAATGAALATAFFLGRSRKK